MQLQKIVYYAQVESLVHYKKPLFSEKIEAWRGGPVVRELYEKHKGLKFINDTKLGDSENLTSEQKACIDWAFDKYGKLDGDTLSHITHLEKPWINARKGVPQGARSSEEITPQSMLKYYSNLPNYDDLDNQDES